MLQLWFGPVGVGDLPDMSQPTWRRGLVWKDEKLYAFEHQSVLVMRMWPDMLAWRRTKTKPWAATRRYADERIAGELLKPGEIERYALFRTKFGGPLRWEDCFDRRKLDFAALLPAYQAIPDRERGIASKFCDRRWHVLALMARCPGAADLMEANPALGYMLANSWVLKAATPTQPMRAARAVLSKSQTHIQSWLDLPGTERVRRILQKIEPQALQGRTLPLLQQALWRPELQDMLAHLPRISADVLRFVLDQDSMSRLTPKFLAEVVSQSTRHAESEEGGGLGAVGLWVDSIRMARHIGSPALPSVPTRASGAAAEPVAGPGSASRGAAGRGVCGRSARGGFEAGANGVFAEAASSNASGPSASATGHATDSPGRELVQCLCLARHVTTTQGDEMTTLSERIAALKAAGRLLTQMAKAPDPSEAVRVGRWYLEDYPTDAELDRRLSDLEGYRLLLATRRIERVRALVEELQSPNASRFSELDRAWIDEAHRIERHYPRRHELREAVRSPHGARVWADFYLDRPSRQASLLTLGDAWVWAGRPAARREALRRLPYVIACLERDEQFPPLGVSAARQVLAQLPTKAELGRRLSGLGSRRFHDALDALEQGCQLVEAVVDGTLPASVRQQQLVNAIGLHLPHSECFPLFGLDPRQRRTWNRWLFQSGVRKR